MKNVRLVSDVEYAKMMIEGIVLNGGYCPCKLDKTIENRCPCDELLKNETCTCGLYITEINKNDFKKQ